MGVKGKIRDHLIHDEDLLQTQFDLSTWPMVDESALSEARRKKFLLRKKAIELYISGANEAQLLKKTGEIRTNIYRIITSRCLAIHPDGDIYGWRGALHYYRVKSYDRQHPPAPQANGSGASGALQWLFEIPKARDLKERFHKQIIGSSEALAHPKPNVQRLFRWLIGELRALGLEKEGQWPFNTETLGYQSIRLYIKKVTQAHPLLALSKIGGPDAIAKAKASDGTRRPDFKLFDRGGFKSEVQHLIR